MKGRSGQVALYLVLVLVAVTVLVLMNVGTYLAVTAKNRAMNAGDAAALAVARHQGWLLREIGRRNLAHLRAALANDAARCRSLMDDQRRLCFLGPLEGLRIGSEWAARNGIEAADEEAAEILRQHVIDIRTGYANDLEQYPEPWEGAWLEYASVLEAYLFGGLCAAPDNIDFLDAAGGHLLLNPLFYEAIAGRNWCWFHFFARGALEGYSGFGDWGPLPSADEATRRRRCCNSEIYSLHLEARAGSAVTLLGRDLVRELTGCTEEDLRRSSLLFDESQVWYFYGNDLWRRWWELDPDANDQNGGRGLPVVGSVRPEYDVRGCAAVCRVANRIPHVLSDDAAGVNRWTAAAKPFAQILDGEGELANAGFVTPVDYDEVRLVPWDSVGGRDLERPNLSMVRHVRRHLSAYLANGRAGLASDCFFCTQLREWENPLLREQARTWLKINSQSCVRAAGSGGERGGTTHAH